MTKIYESDPWLEPYKQAIDARHERILATAKKLTASVADAGTEVGEGVGPGTGASKMKDPASKSRAGYGARLNKAVNNHLYYGLHRDAEGWVLREWAPNATRIYLIGDFNNWKRSPAWELKPIGSGNWELRVPQMFIRHGELYKLFIEWPGGGAERLPAYVTRVVQDPETKVFSAQVWAPATPYHWSHPTPVSCEADKGSPAGGVGLAPQGRATRSASCEADEWAAACKEGVLAAERRAAHGNVSGRGPSSGLGGMRGGAPNRIGSQDPLRQPPFIYECHIGMATEQEKVGSFEEFRRDVLPRVKKLGYNVLQIMALQEHPYYGSFGYQVSNFFALSSRFGTPEEFKALVDEAHGMGISVIMDIVHSHSVSNEAEGLGRFDGREDLYFYQGDAGHHPAWGSRCFDYGKDEVQYFLLSNCKFWMEEYHLDGFRFDGVTSMLYWDHGLGTDFGDYSLYFGPGVDGNAVTYLALANMLIHEIRPDAITIAEDVSGMAGLAAPFEAGGVGFDYRMAMGVADHWIKWIKEKSDEQWSPGEMWFELTRKRDDERTVSYAECHDQALVGDKTLIFRLIDKEMYWCMDKASQNLTVDRGMALHKMIRLVTAATAGDGYLTFMGNEFGHPEWIDFPREGNGWSYKYARRQWSLADNPALRYGQLQDFDSAMVHLLEERGVLTERPVLLRADEEKKILVFLRKNCIFAFNFNPSESFENYGFDAPEGEYVLALDSDQTEFGGFARLQAGESHITMDARLSLYLPSRCALVLLRKEAKK